MHDYFHCYSIFFLSFIYTYFIVISILQFNHLEDNKGQKDITLKSFFAAQTRHN